MLNLAATSRPIYSLHQISNGTLTPMRSYKRIRDNNGTVIIGSYQQIDTDNNSSPLSQTAHSKKLVNTKYARLEETAQNWQFCCYVHVIGSKPSNFPITNSIGKAFGSWQQWHPCGPSYSARCLGWWPSCSITMSDNELISVITMLKIGKCSFNCLEFSLRNETHEEQIQINNECSIRMLIYLGPLPIERRICWPVKMGGRTTYWTLPPKRTPFQTGIYRWPNLWMVPRRRWISHTYLMWLWVHS
jgi:hypothetical protein